MFKKTIHRIESILYDMPWWMFWGIFSGLTWFYLIRRTISWDLWWHMAAGKFFWQNGYYPPPGTFTYSPVNEGVLLTKTFLGDLLFHFAYIIWPTEPMSMLKVVVIAFVVFSYLHAKSFKLILKDSWIPALILLALLFLPAGGRFGQTWMVGISFYQVWFWMTSRGKWPDWKFAPWFHFPMAAVCLYLLIVPIQETFFFGDIINYMTREWGHFGGLQILRIAFIMSAVIFFLNICSFKYNVWTLLASVIIVIGTTQMHLTKNALFATFFMSCFAWMWIQIKFHRRRYFIWFYPPLILLWSCMHGYAKLGWVFFFFIVCGEFIDQGIRYFKTRKVDVLLLVGLLIALLIPMEKIHNDYGLYGEFEKVIDLVLPSSSESSASNSSSSAATTTDTKPDQLQRLKKMFRFIFSGTDAEKVAEYQWPVINAFVFSTKLIFVLNILLYTYLIFMTSMLRSRLYASLIIPSIAMSYIGLGYLRTISFAFLFVFLFMAYTLRDGIPDCHPEKRKKNALIMGGISIFFLLLYWMSDLFSHLMMLFHEGLKHRGVIFVHYLVYPFVLVIPVIILVLLIREEKWYKESLRYLKTGMGVIVILNLLIYLGFTNYKYIRDDFHTVSGFLDTEQGIGKSNKFFDTIPNYVEKTIPNERNIFNTYNMGGYLLWKWYDKRKVFIDGRSSIYQGKFYHDYTHGNLGYWLNKKNLQKGIFNFLVDKQFLRIFVEKNWYPIAFDSCMVLLKRANSKEEAFGVLPEYLEGERELDRLEYLDREALGLFFDSYTRQMMITGRMKDTAEFCKRFKHVIRHLPLNFQLSLVNRMNLINNGINMFGNINHVSLGKVWHNVYSNIKGLEYHKAVGMAAYHIQKNDLAYNELVKAHELDKKDPELLYHIGEVLIRKNEIQKGVNLIHQALKMSHNMKYYNRLAVTLMRVGNFKEARSICEQGMKKHPRNHEIFFNYGIILLQSRDYEKAKQVFQKVLQLKPDFAPAAQQIQSLEQKLKSAQ